MQYVVGILGKEKEWRVMPKLVNVSDGFGQFQPDQVWYVWEFNLILCFKWCLDLAYLIPRDLSLFCKKSESKFLSRPSKKVI